MRFGGVLIIRTTGNTGTPQLTVIMFYALPQLSPAVTTRSRPMCTRELFDMVMVDLDFSLQVNDFARAAPMLAAILLCNLHAGR